MAGVLEESKNLMAHTLHWIVVGGCLVVQEGQQVIIAQFSLGLQRFNNLSEFIVGVELDFLHQHKFSCLLVAQHSLIRVLRLAVNMKTVEEAACFVSLIHIKMPLMFIH